MTDTFRPQTLEGNVTIDRTPSLSNLIPALVEAQKAMGPLVRNSSNPFYKSKYADLEQVVNLAFPHLLNNGITVAQGIIVRDDQKFLQTRLLHVSGEMYETLYPLHVADERDPQKLGSAFTYARRYSLMAILGLAPEDDDGNSNVGTAQTSARTTATPAGAELPEQFNGLVELFRKKKWTRSAADKASVTRFKVPVSDLSKEQIKTWESELAVPF